MRLLFAIPCLMALLSTNASADLRMRDYTAAFEMGVSNLGVLPAKEKISTQLPLDPITLREDLYIMIFSENLRGDLAYDILSGILQMGSDAPTVFHDRVIRYLDTLGLSDDQKRDIESLLAGNPPSFKGAFHTRQAGPSEVFSEVEKAISILPSFLPGRKKLLDAVVFLQNLIVPSDSDCYGNDPGCVFDRNAGIIAYISKQLNGSMEFFTDSVRFYLRIAKLDQSSPHTGDFSVFDHTPSVDIWPLAMDAVGGDAVRAIRVLEVYGHDQCCNSVFNAGPDPRLDGAFQVLNAISPTANSDDAPHSVIQAPGALHGLRISAELEQEFSKLKDRYIKLGVEPPVFASGYYHVLGGALTANEMIRNGYDIDGALKISTFFSEGLGYYYKKFTMTMWMTEDAITLWESIDEDETRQPNTPKGWDQRRFDLAKLSLDTAVLDLKRTREEHRLGAQFVYSIFQGL